MTQSTAELVRAFKAHGGKVAFIPLGILGECVEKTFHERLYARRARIVFTEAKENYYRNTREKRLWSNRWRVPVDVAMAHNMDGRDKE